MKKSKIYFRLGIVIGLCFTMFFMGYQHNVLPVQTRVCTPSEKVGFMKNYKTGSTAIQNILLRRSLLYGLNVIVPKRGQNQIFTGGMIPFNSSWLDDQVPWHKTYMRESMYDIMALHCMWNHPVISGMLGETARYVTIVRDPADTLESHYKYYDWGKQTKMNFTAYVNALAKDDKRRKAELGRLNTQIKMLGMTPVRRMEDQEEIDRMILQVDLQFDLVMLQDRFDESLVLLADVLCWDLKDVVTLTLNSRANEMKHTVSSREREILKKLQKADNALYQYFVKEFDKKVTAYGQTRMAQDVQKLKKIRISKIEECDIKPHEKGSKGQPFAMGYRGGLNTYDVKKLSSEECKSLVSNEMTMIGKVYDSMKERWDRKTQVAN